MAGKSVIESPIDAILRELWEGLAWRGVLEDYPNLKEEDVRAALIYTAELVE